MKKSGGVFITVRDSDKDAIVSITNKFSDLGFKLYATHGTADVLRRSGITVEVVEKIHQGSPNTLDLLESGKVDYVISTSKKGRTPHQDDEKIRRKAVERRIPCITSLDTASAVARCLAMNKTIDDIELVDITSL